MADSSRRRRASEAAGRDGVGRRTARGGGVPQSQNGSEQTDSFEMRESLFTSVIESIEFVTRSCPSRSQSLLVQDAPDRQEIFSNNTPQVENMRLCQVVESKPLSAEEDGHLLYTTVVLCHSVHTERSFTNSEPFSQDQFESDQFVHFIFIVSR